MGELLTSDWGADGLNKHLIAKIYPVKKKEGSGEYIYSDADVMVAAPLTDGNIDITLNWQSAFENYGTDAKYSTVSQMLQSGQAEVMLNLFSQFLPKDKAGVIGDALREASEKAKSLAKDVSQLTGKTGITKLNSLQVFSGLPPIKIPITMYFRAWADPKKEVENPINQLFSWALPQKLADSVGENVVKNAQEQGFNLELLFPSDIPRFVALEYGGRTYNPLVIESIGHPLVLPRSKDGAMLSASVQLTLATLTAWGKDDYARSLGATAY